MELLNSLCLVLSFDNDEGDLLEELGDLLSNGVEDVNVADCQFSLGDPGLLRQVGSFGHLQALLTRDKDATRDLQLLLALVHDVLYGGCERYMHQTQVIQLVEAVGSGKLLSRECGTSPSHEGMSGDRDSSAPRSRRRGRRTSRKTTAGNRGERRS